LKAKQSDCPPTSLAPTITVGLCVSVVGRVGFRGKIFSTGDCSRSLTISFSYGITDLAAVGALVGALSRT
jgi:hypothetical protein